MDVLKIQRPNTVAEAAAEALIRYIAANKLTAGDKLPSERELVQMTGVSRLPLREALCILKGLGIVESKHGKGVFLRPLDMAALFGMLSPLLKAHAQIDVKHIFEVRLHLEASIADIAAVNRTDANLAALRAAQDGMRSNLVDDRRSYIEHDMAFHRELGHATANPIYHVFMASITDLLFEVQQMYQDSIDVRRMAVAEHEGILAAIVAGNGEQASAAMRIHIQNAGDRL